MSKNEKTDKESDFLDKKYKVEGREGVGSYVELDEFTKAIIRDKFLDYGFTSQEKEKFFEPIMQEILKRQRNFQGGRSFYNVTSFGKKQTVSIQIKENWLNEKFNKFVEPKPIPIFRLREEKVGDREIGPRDFLVIEGIVFYKSSGTSESGFGVKSSARADIRAATWIPCLGMQELSVENEKKSKKQGVTPSSANSIVAKAGTIVKYKHAETAYGKESDALLKNYLDHLEREIRDGKDVDSLFKEVSDHLMTDKMSKQYESEKQLGCNEAIQGLREDLFARFGSVSNMLISIKLSEGDKESFWNNHKYGKLLREQLKKDFAFYFNLKRGYQIAQEPELDAQTSFIPIETATYNKAGTTEKKKYDDEESARSKKVNIWIGQQLNLAYTTQDSFQKALFNRIEAFDRNIRQQQQQEQLRGLLKTLNQACITYIASFGDTKEKKLKTGGFFSANIDQKYKNTIALQSEIKKLFDQTITPKEIYELINKYKKMNDKTMSVFSIGGPNRIATMLQAAEDVLQKLQTTKPEIMGQPEQPKKKEGPR